MKKTLLNLFNVFLTYEKMLLKYSLLLTLRFGSFCTTTKVGTVFLYLLAFGLFFLPYPIAMVCLIILSDVLIVALLCTILDQFEYSRKHLKNLIGADNFSKYVG